MERSAQLFGSREQRRTSAKRVVFSSCSSGRHRLLWSTGPSEISKLSSRSLPRLRIELPFPSATCAWPSNTSRKALRLRNGQATPRRRRNALRGRNGRRERSRRSSRLGAQLDGCTVHRFSIRMYGRRMPKRSRPSSFYVGCFHFDERSPRGPRSGSFQLVVEATIPDDAAEKCHAQLCELRETTPITLDAGGRITSLRGTTFTWSRKGYLRQAQDPAPAVAEVYSVDAQGPGSRRGRERIASITSMKASIELYWFIDCLCEKSGRIEP